MIGRSDVLSQDFPDPDRLRKIAGDIKQHTLDHLDRYLEEAVTSLERNGATVHFAADGQEAKEIVRDILKANDARRIVKSKSMVTEDIHLNSFSS